MKNDFVTKTDLRETAEGLHKKIDSFKTGLQQEITSSKNELREEITFVKNELHEEITSSKNELHEEITSVKDELRAEIASVKDELRGEITSVKNELNEKISSVETNLKKDIECVAVQVVGVSSDLQEFKQETRNNFNTVITSIDGLVGLITNGQTELAAMNHALMRHENRLDNYESRLTAIEKRNR